MKNRFALAPMTNQQRRAPVTAAYMASEGLGAAFIDYLRARRNFVHAAAD